MTAIPQQSLDFLKQSAPFDLLADDELISVAHQVHVAYLTQENATQILEEQKGRLFLISSGQFSVKDNSGPVRHLSEGDFFGYSNLIDNLDTPISVDVDSAGLVYCINPSSFHTCCQDCPEFERFFRHLNDDKIQSQAVNDSKSMWLYRRIEDAITRNPVSCDHSIAIVDAVKLMASEGVSSLLVTDNGKLVGIVTDRDIRNRVVAEQIDVQLPVANIMTAAPFSVGHKRTMFDALCVMTEHGIHHLPVINSDTQVPMGMLTASDMIRHQRGNVLFLIDELAKADSLYELTRLAWQMPHYFAKHARRLGDFDVAGKVLSQATDIMTRKLINFFQQQHGPAPQPFCWLVYGSQAREDQTMGSDQDNALLLATRPDKQQAGYFAQMSEYVCNGLGKCGIRLCSGNIMASNPDLRLGLDDAINEAKAWVNAPTSDAIMHFNIFLDVRPVAGDVALFETLQEARAPLLKQPIFLAALARHTNDIQVPLSMFQKFVFEKHQSKPDLIDLKVNAIAIVNNIVRIHALASGIKAPSSLARLRVLGEQQVITEKDAANLRDIWLFLNRLRWRHQLGNNVTDNLVSVNELSSLEKHQLKAAFQAIKRSQQALVMTYSGGIG